MAHHLHWYRSKFLTKASEGDCGWIAAAAQLPDRIGSDEHLQKDFQDSRSLDVIRLYAGDVWRVSRRVTVSGGLSWMYEPDVLNLDLTKPALLAPILGPDRLGPPAAPRASFLPMFGGPWLATGDGKTLVRGGAGRYSDGTSWANSIHLFNERRYLMPLGIGRFTVSSANFLCDGQTLNFNRPTIHAGLSVKRELPSGIVASADVVYKRYRHTFLNGIDYNHFYSAAGPVIPPCSVAQRADDQAVCSNGPIYFDTTAGRALSGPAHTRRKRLSAGTQFLVSYALGSYRGTDGSANGTVEATGGRATGFNNDNWFENDGPLPSDLRHVLNVSGMVMAPWRVEISFNVSAHSGRRFPRT